MCSMTVEFNHTIVWSRDSKASAAFLAEVLGLPGPKSWGPFQVVSTGNGVSIDFMDKEGEISLQHLLVRIWVCGCIRECIEHWFRAR